MGRIMIKMKGSSNESSCGRDEAVIRVEIEPLDG